MNRRSSIRAGIVPAAVGVFPPGLFYPEPYRILTQARGDLDAVRGDGRKITLGARSVKDLRKSLQGASSWRRARGTTKRRVLNPVIDKRPVLIVQPTGIDDVRRAVAFASANGVVTAFEFQLHPLPRRVLGGNIVFPIRRAREVLACYADYSVAAPDDLYLDCFVSRPPGGADGLVGMAVCYSGPPSDADRVLGPVGKLGSPGCRSDSADRLRRPAAIDRCGGPPRLGDLPEERLHRRNHSEADRHDPGGIRGRSGSVDRRLSPARRWRDRAGRDRGDRVRASVRTAQPDGHRVLGRGNRLCRPHRLGKEVLDHAGAAHSRGLRES